MAITPPTKKEIKEVIPNCCIGVDVIVGFPGETDEHFLSTYHFLNELDISYLHVFTYSERDNTEAASMETGILPPLMAMTMKFNRTPTKIAMK